MERVQSFFTRALQCFCLLLAIEKRFSHLFILSTGAVANQIRARRAQRLRADSTPNLAEVHEKGVVESFSYHYK